MVTSQSVAARILDYLNGQLTLTDLLAWTENTLALLLESNEDTPDEQTLIRILSYLGAGDSADFPLTWEILSGFLDQLGIRVHVTAEMN